jgi:hypothetical protein
MPDDLYEETPHICFTEWKKKGYAAFRMIIFADSGMSKA